MHPIHPLDPESALIEDLMKKTEDPEEDPALTAKEGTPEDHLVNHQEELSLEGK